MYMRVDPAKSAGTDYFVMDNDQDLQSLKNRNQLDCYGGGHLDLPKTELKESQTITCEATGNSLYTLIYRT